MLLPVVAAALTCPSGVKSWIATFAPKAVETLTGEWRIFVRGLVFLSVISATAVETVVVGLGRRRKRSWPMLRKNLIL